MQQRKRGNKQMKMKTVNREKSKERGEKYLINYYENKDNACLHAIKQIYRKFFHKEKDYSFISRNVIADFERQPELFQAIEIETINRCNGVCAFCPVNSRVDKREYKLMEEEIFYKIIDELAELNYSGTVDLCSNNEPFLDKRIIQFAKYARQMLPNAYLFFYTNGTLLTTDLFREIEPYVNRIDIDNYSDTLEMIPSIRKIYDYCYENDIESKKVNIILRKVNEVLSSRGGQAPNKLNAKASKKPCILPYVQLVVRSEGKVSLCCNDALGRYTMGDLHMQTLKEIWFCKEYVSVRREMSQNGRKNLPLCNACDVEHGIEF